jgi:hypothetical protein
MKSSPLPLLVNHHADLLCTGGVPFGKGFLCGQIVKLKNPGLVLWLQVQSIKLIRLRIELM